MKNIIHLLFLLLASSTLIFAGGFLKVSGKYISDDSGEILLRGIGLGGWLVPEGYMLQTPGYGSPTDIRNKIVDLIGEAKADTFFAHYRQNFVTREDIDQIAQWGFNSIRLPMHYALLTPKDQPGVYSEEGFAIIDSLLNWCETDHIYLILDLHCAPGGQNSANISDYISGEPSLWESSQNQTRTIDLWKTLAARYHNKEWIGGYDLLNETVWSFSSNNKELHDLYVSITAAIREVDTTHIIFIEGNNWANDFTGLGTPWDSKMVYSFHKYWNSNDAGSINSYISLRSTANRPLWLGESGENSNQWFADAIALMESNNIGWSWWTYKKIGTINGMLNVVKQSDYNTLLNYWRGGGTKPSVDFAFNALMAQAEKFKLSQCQSRPDVLDAMFRMPFTDKTKPFAENIVPGKILAINYDMGKNGKSYSDVDYQNITNNGSWNSGGEYRNDGVDIEKCSDLFSGGYNVGWINANEYLRFTFTASEEGDYSLSARVAAQNAGGRILVRIDDSVIVGLGSVPATGGYKSFQTITIGSCHLTQGTHNLQLYFTSGDFNITYVDFAATPTEVRKTNDIPKTFALSQNYPNPFNPETRISFSVPVESQVTLKVYDLLGKEIATLVNGKKQAGTYTVGFNAMQYPSGIYFYVLHAGNYIQTRKLVYIK